MRAYVLLHFIIRDEWNFTLKLVFEVTDGNAYFVILHNSAQVNVLDLISQLPNICSILDNFCMVLEEENLYVCFTFFIHSLGVSITFGT